MKRVLLYTAIALVVIGCQGDKYPTEFVNDLPFGLRYNISQKEAFVILDSLVDKKILTIPYQGSKEYNYQLQFDKTVTLSISPRFYNNLLYYIDIREGDLLNNKSRKENYKIARTFFKSQKINLNAYNKMNDNISKEYTWNRDNKKYEISLYYDNSFILIFEDGSISKKVNKESSAQVIKEASERYEKKEGGQNVQNSSWDGSVRHVEVYLKNTLKDPKSYESIEWSKVIETETGYVVWHKYRAKNSFGGYVIENQKFYLDFKGNVIKVE